MVIVRRGGHSEEGRGVVIVRRGGGGGEGLVCDAVYGTPCKWD